MKISHQKDNKVILSTKLKTQCFFFYKIQCFFYKNLYWAFPEKETVLSPLYWEYLFFWSWPPWIPNDLTKTPGNFLFFCIDHLFHSNFGMLPGIPTTFTLAPWILPKRLIKNSHDPFSASGPKYFPNQLLT